MAIIDTPEVREPEPESLIAEYPKVVSLSAKPTDQELADKIKKMLNDNFEPVLKTMDWARQQGLIPTFNVAVGPNGKYQLQNLDLARHF